jgi:hypothetical protein
VADGRIRHFIRGEQIIRALGMINSQNRPLSPKEISLDAITVDRNDAIYLSFEKDHTLRLYCGGGLSNFTMRDGAVAVILPSYWSKTATGDVLAVANRRGRIILTETRIDAMQANAKIADAAGACPTACLDVDGLAIDRRGGTFTAVWCKTKMVLPNLLYSTEAYTGAGVASTRNNGEIAKMNGCELAQGCTAAATPTDGKQMGLKPGAKVSNIDALVTLDREPCRFVLGTPSVKSLGGPCTWHVGTNMNVAAVLLYAGNGAIPVSPSTNFTAAFGLPTDCFPHVFGNVFTFGPIVIPMVADGWGGRVGTLGPFAVPAAVAPNGLISQAFVVHNGKWQLSTPMTFVQ